MTAVGLFSDLATHEDVVAPHTTEIPDGDETAVRVRPTPSRVFRTSFSKVIASGVDPGFGVVLKLGSGMSVGQSGGNLVITAGVVANSETIIRCPDEVMGGIRLRQKTILSQRIANQEFYVELVDVIADDAAAAIVSATSMTVTLPPGHGMTSQNVGQGIYLGGYVGTGTFVPGRYVIAGVSGDVVTFTVAGMAPGAGTVCLFGRSYYRLLYDGTSATNVKFDSQRLGWCTGDSSLSCSTTASPGHIAMIVANDMQAAVMDRLAATSAGLQDNTRGSRSENVPDDVALRLQLRVVNKSTAPASTTSWTVGFVSLTNYSALDTVTQDLRAVPANSASPVSVVNSAAVTANQGTLNSGSVNKVTTTAGTNSANIKTSAATVYSVLAHNPTATPAHIKLYDLASAPTVGTTLPVHTITVPANSDVVEQFGALGARFGTGLGRAVTGAWADTDTTNAPAGVVVNITYI